MYLARAAVGACEPPELAVSMLTSQRLADVSRGANSCILPLC